MARVKGNITPVLSFARTGSPAITLKDLGAYATSIELGDGEGEAVTFSDVASGARPVAMTVSFVLDFDANAAWNFLNTNAGAAGVTWVYQPMGSATTSASAPKFTGVCTLPPQPLFGLEKGTEVGEFEVTIELDTYTVAVS